MKQISQENYLKAIYWITDKQGHAGTNDIAQRLHTKASSVTDMVKKLSEKKLLKYTPYQGVALTKKGTTEALKVIRKHRLWEVFLVDKLQFKWDEVHDIAEQMEHVDSKELIERLDEYLGKPDFDPHGDPIPDENGSIATIETVLLTEMKTGDSGIVTGVVDSSTSLLQHLENLQIGIGSKIRIKNVIPYDHSMEIVLGTKQDLVISEMVGKNIMVKRK